MSPTPTFLLHTAIAADLHNCLRDVVDFLDGVATDEEFASSPGMTTSLATVLSAVRELEASVLPLAPAPLPSDAELEWAASVKDREACATPISLDLEPARRLVEASLQQSSRLNHLLQRIQDSTLDDADRSAITLQFAFVMGFLYTELCLPLHEIHQELEDMCLGEPS